MCVFSNKVLTEMIDYYKGDPKRIQHFIKVHAFAKLIGEQENLSKNELEILEISAYVHDIGIKIAEEKYNDCNGKLQEQEGSEVAKKLLELLNVKQDVIERVCYLVGHHHTYKDIDGLDYQILIEADFLVNLFEDNASKDSIQTAYKNIFKTNSGKLLCEKIFDILN